MNDKWVGAHVGIGGGVHMALQCGSNISARSIALFLRNQRTWTAPPLSSEHQTKFKAMRAELDFDRDFQILPHGSYLVNLANNDPTMWKRSYAGLLDDLRRCEALGIQMYNMHPGSAIGKCPTDEAIEHLIRGLNDIISETSSVVVVLENMAGQGRTLGKSFEELAKIIAGIQNKDRVGVCLDTCHLFGAGYDIRTSKSFGSVMDRFDQTVGISYLRGIHLNDSKHPLGSNKDRHESIGKGFIGLDSFRFIMNDPRFSRMPLVLETPGTYFNYIQEIKLLYDLVQI